MHLRHDTATCTYIITPASQKLLLFSFSKQEVIIVVASQNGPKLFKRPHFRLKRPYIKIIGKNSQKLKIQRYIVL